MAKIQIPIPAEPCADERPMHQEWLDTNGRGGYASSTLLNCHTRKYHGLLVANLASPPGRFVLLSKFEDSLRLQGQESFLSCHQYPGCFFPASVLLREFHLDDYPVFLYETNIPPPNAPAPSLLRRKGRVRFDGTIRLHKSILMIPGEDTVLIRYDLEKSPAAAVLRLRPLLAFRGYHDLSRRNSFLKTQVHSEPNGFRMHPYEGMPPLYVQTNRKGRFMQEAQWYENFEYAAEHERGYDWLEDLFTPGIIEVPIRVGEAIIVRAATTPGTGKLLREWQGEEARRREEQRIFVLPGMAGPDYKAIPSVLPEAKGLTDEDRSYLGILLKAGRKFLITTPAGRPALIAGYPWFGDWGRDTLIALPGLTFCSGKLAEGAAIIASLGDHERDGLLPNFFAEEGCDPPYNTVDSSLWFFWTIQQYLIYGGDIERVRQQFWPVMKRIVARFLDGTVRRIGMDTQGLLHAGDGTAALTWMDAMVGNRPVTPRDGYAVEINALWYNALAFVEQLSQQFGEQAFDLDGLLRKIRQSFQDTFWIDEKHYLGDVHSQGKLDRSIRPNQILAVSLPYSPLDPFKWKAVVRTVSEHLLAPCGLHTLSPGDPAYRGHYGGNQATRDQAYHQGTIWPWLLGHFAEATLRVAEDRTAAREVLLQHLRTFLQEHLPEAGVGGVSEIFNGDAPHRPDGCINQAWSVGELIRLYGVLDHV